VYYSSKERLFMNAKKLSITLVLSVMLSAGVALAEASITIQ